MAAKVLLVLLEDIDDADLHTFKSYLETGVDGYEFSRKLLKDAKSKEDVVSCITARCGLQQAARLVEKVLMKMAKDHRATKYESKLGYESTADKSMSLPTCCFCAYLKDLDTCWKQVCPSVCSEGRELLPDETGKEEDCKYSCTPAGSYECTVTGLRWVCDGDVTLKYHLTDWEPYEEELKRMGYEPCGPLFDITITFGVLKEVHLPHFVCLGSGAHIKDAVQALDVQDSGMILEACELTRFHAKLYNPTFSPKGLLVKTGFSVKTHCAVLIYQMLRAHLTLHVYLVPWDSRMLKSIEKMEKDALRIQQSNTECSLQMKYLYKLEIEPKNEDNPPLIQPETLKLRYTTISPNYFEVYIRNAIHDFELHLKNDENECVWKRKIQAVAYNQGLVSFAVWFYNKHMSKLIQRVSLVDPIADDLKSLIGNERYSIIINSQTSQEKMRKLFSFLSGEQQMLSLFQSLLKNEPLLVLDLVKQP